MRFLPRPPKASPVLAFLLGAVLLAGCVQPRAGAQAPSSGARFTVHELPGVGEARLQTLVGAERVAPLRYRVIVLPGSGCAGLGPFAERYFAGLLHARVWVLHKPGMRPDDRTPPGDCPVDFVRQDALSAWQVHALAAVRALAREVPRLAGLVLLSSSGLDPREAGEMQARRLGVLPAWEALDRAQAGTAPDGTVVQGRSLLYASPIQAFSQLKKRCS